MSTVPVPDELLARLERRAHRDGITAEELVVRGLRGFLEQDPYEFFGVGSSEVLRRVDIDERPSETGFGHARSGRDHQQRAPGGCD